MIYVRDTQGNITHTRERVRMQVSVCRQITNINMNFVRYTICKSEGTNI